MCALFLLIVISPLSCISKPNSYIYIKTTILGLSTSIKYYLNFYYFLSVMHASGQWSFYVAVFQFIMLEVII